MRISNRKVNKKKLLIPIAAIVVAILAYTGVAYAYNLFPFQKATNTDTHGTINFKKSPAEKKAEQEVKTNPKQAKTEPQNTDTPPSPPTSPQTGKKEANVVLTNVGVQDGSVQASGFISNIVETDGTCSFVFTSPNGQVVTKSTSTLQNPSSTACKTITFPASELSSGSWQVQINYSSPDAAGSSNKMTLNVS